MAGKSCCIENCQSNSTRKEDKGVTFHKYPKEQSLLNKWVAITHNTPLNSVVSYVCSRHFCKTDFKSFEASKFKLKPDSVPTIFSWTMDKEFDKVKDEKMEDIIEDLNQNSEEESANHKTSNLTDNKRNMNSNKESEIENVDAIQKFLDGPEDKSEDFKHPQTPKDLDINTDEKFKGNDDQITDKELTTLLGNNNENSSECIKSNVAGMILNNTNIENRYVKPNIIPRIKKPNMIASSINKGEGSMSLSIGSKVEVRDFGFIWHPSEIAEVDFEEMEVLVRYDNPLKKSDEWININSPRIRPFGIMKPETQEQPDKSSSMDSTTGLLANSSTNDENKTDEKPLVLFEVGERCLARWRDNRRFMATITGDLGNEHYEVLFDDGFKWTCPAGRLSKCKKSIKNEPVDSPMPQKENAVAAGPSNTPVPPFHTHLFDPARDYLGSKSERRAMKRKLNIKEIFNIGQKKLKKKLMPGPKKVVEKKPKAAKTKTETKEDAVEGSVKNEVPDAVASIIGSDVKLEADIKLEDKQNIKNENIMDSEMQMNFKCKEIKEEIISNETVVIDPNVDMDLNDESDEYKDSVLEEEQILENFEKPDNTAHIVIDRIKEVISKLEGGLYEEKPPIETAKKVKDICIPEIVLETPSKAEKPPELEISQSVQMSVLIEEVPKTEDATPAPDVKLEDSTARVITKHSSKVKKSKKLRLLQEKKVERQVQKVKNELEEMKKQMEEMRKQMLVKTEEFAKQSPQLPDSFLLPGEWCCKWVNRQPVGTVCEVESEVKFDGNNKPVLPRRSVQVEDKRLPEGWAKHMVRRSFGNSAGKWDIVLVSPENRRFHTRVEMRHFLDTHPELKEYERALLDFGVHIKLARRMGWVTETPDGATESPTPLPVGTLSTTSPLYKKKQLSLSKNKDGVKKKRKYMRSMKYARNLEVFEGSFGHDTINELQAKDNQQPTIEDGFVWVGSLKVQILDNLLRCPAEGCFKNFRNSTLIKMHIKHYHRELRKMLGATPKVLDLAYERTKPDLVELPPTKREFKTLKVKIPRPPKANKPSETLTLQSTEVKQEHNIPVLPAAEDITPMQDSPKLRVALNKPVKRPKVLLPVRRALEMKEEVKEEVENLSDHPEALSDLEPLDFETAISTHTVTKPLLDSKFGQLQNKNFSEDDEYDAAPLSSDVDTRSSFPRSESPDSKSFGDRMILPPISSGVDSNDEKDRKMYMFDENGDRIRIVHMKREEIINCHCGFREEDGLMVQCELCLCWQHALCHNILREADVPEKYTCSICLNPRRGRRSKRYLHDQDRLYEGLLPGAKPCESLRRSHELSGNLLKIQDALHALRVTYHVATKKDHPKLYLWAKDWEATELSLTQERLNSDYSDLNIMISDIGKENLPIKEEQLQTEVRTPPTEDQDERLSQKDGLPQCLLNGLLSSPSCASLDLPISTSDLERLAKSVQDQESARIITAPEPEAAIDNNVCRERLLRHIQRCQALVDARLDCIDAQVAELESQDPSFEDDETADYFPRTKQTVQMLMRDIDVMDELGVIT